MSSKNDFSPTSTEVKSRVVSRIALGLALAGIALVAAGVMALSISNGDEVIKAEVRHEAVVQQPGGSADVR